MCQGMDNTCVDGGSPCHYGDLPCCPGYQCVDNSLLGNVAYCVTEN